MLNRSTPDKPEMRLGHSYGARARVSYISMPRNAVSARHRKIT